MRTNIDIDDQLIAAAMAATGLATKKATVEEALRRLVVRHRQVAAVADMAGLGWAGPGWDEPETAREDRPAGGD